MPNAAVNESKPKTAELDSSPLKTFLRARWAGLLMSAVVGYLFVQYLGVTTLPPWVLNHRILPNWAENHAAGLWLVAIVRWFIALAHHYAELLWVPIAACFFGLGVLLDRTADRLSENNYKTLLIGRYLRRRRIAWVSLIAVMLCTMMVLVVISVMGGWLRMFKNSFRGLSGDIIIHCDSLRGFAYYNEIIDAIKKDPTCKVEAAVPTIETGALFSFGNNPTFAQVMGMKIEDIGQVNQFYGSLHLQHEVIQQTLNDDNLPAREREKLSRKLQQPPSFNLLNETNVPMSALPPGLAYPKPEHSDEVITPGTIAMPGDFPPRLKGKLRYDALRQNLIFSGPMPGIWKAKLDSLSSDAGYRQAIQRLYEESNSNDRIDYPPVKGKYSGMIVGTGVIGIRRNREGKWPERGMVEFTTPITLTLLDLSSTEKREVPQHYFIVDDSHLGVWQYDQSYVYVDFDTLQKSLSMDEQALTVDDKPAIKPARATDIHIRVKPGIDPENEIQLGAVRDRIRAVVEKVRATREIIQPSLESAPRVYVDTWQDSKRIWISTVENEKSMLVFLFGIISIVAIFLIFCIFYMIVAEKTKDIGIIKSEGATALGVTSIFLGYGLVIGIVGAAMGLLLSYLILHDINPLHRWLYKTFGLLIWNPEVYMFDEIPNTMSGTDVAVIIPIAVLASVIGAVVPAILAGRKNPVESLRWE